MKHLVIASLLIAALAALVWSAIDPEQVLEPEDRRLRKAPDVKTYFTDYNNGTLVNFNHKEHAEGYGLECIACHHVEACSDCHHKEVKDVQIEEAKVALHKNCINCHRELESGPRKCEECHHK